MFFGVKSYDPEGDERQQQSRAELQAGAARGNITIIEQACSRTFSNLFSLEISRAKALPTFPGCKAAWEAPRGYNVFKNEQHRLNDKSFGLGSTRASVPR